MKKVGKTTKPFRYDLNQTSYDYTVEVINKFKGIDLVEGEPEELRMEVRNIVQEEVTKIILKKKRKTTPWARLEISSRKLEIPREHFMQDRPDKGQKWYGPNRSRRY